MTWIIWRHTLLDLKARKNRKLRFSPRQEERENKRRLRVSKWRKGAPLLSLSLLENTNGYCHCTYVERVRRITRGGRNDGSRSLNRD